MSLTSVWSEWNLIAHWWQVPSNAIRFQAEHKGLFWSFFNSLVQNLAGLVDSVDESIGYEGFLENFLQSSVQIHWSIECDGCADFTINKQFFTVTPTFPDADMTYAQLTLQYRTFWVDFLIFFDKNISTACDFDGVRKEKKEGRRENIQAQFDTT